MNFVDENDWYLYRKLLPLWQEIYIKKLNNEYIRLLSRPSSASDNFWDLKKRINNDSLSEGVIVEVSRSTMSNTIMTMLLKNIITLDDIKDFSEDLRFSMEGVLKTYQQKNTKRRR